MTLWNARFPRYTVYYLRKAIDIKKFAAQCKSHTYLFFKYVYYLLSWWLPMKSPWFLLQWDKKVNIALFYVDLNKDTEPFSCNKAQFSLYHFQDL